MKITLEEAKRALAQVEWEHKTWPTDHTMQVVCRARRMLEILESGRPFIVNVDGFPIPIDECLWIKADALGQQRLCTTKTGGMGLYILDNENATIIRAYFNQGNQS